MRVPRVRFTVGRMMIAVAIVALILGAVVLVERRRDRFRRLAHQYSLEDQATMGPIITRADALRDPLLATKMRDARDRFRRGSVPLITKDDISHDPSMAIIKKYVDAMDLDRRDIYYRGRCSYYYLLLKEKYQYAQRYPWLPVAPDPPPPDPPPP